MRCNVDGLARDGESEPSMSTRTCALIWCRRRSNSRRDFDSDSRFAGDDQIRSVMIVIDVLDDVKGVGVPETVQEFAAFAVAIGCTRRC